MSMALRCQRALLWGAFVLLCIATYINVFVNFADVPNHQIDENAHLEYARYLIDNARWWPDFAHFDIVDRTGFSANQTINYLNHPPTFYWSAKALHALLPSLKLIDYRWLTYALSIINMFLITRLSVRSATTLSTALWCAMLPFTLYMQIQTGFFSNDTSALLGGTIAVIGSLGWFKGEHPRHALLLMLAGLALASVKLTSTLLVGSFVTICILLRYKMLALVPWRDRALIAAALMALAIPYAYMTLHYGSPAPETPGQVQLMQQPKTTSAEGMRWVYTPNHGWGEQAPLSFIGFSVQFLSNFADQLSVPEMTFLPLLVIPLALIYLIVRNHPTRPLAIATLAATLVTLSIHLFFSWERYLRLGWMIDSFIRYYFPLLGAYSYLSAHALNHLLPSRDHHGSPR